MKTKNKVLCIMHMPPPVHGAAVMGQYIHDAKYINDSFECKFINLATAKDLEDVGKLSFQKLSDVYTLCKHIIDSIRNFHPDLIYFTANATGMPFYKDALVLHSIKRTIGKSKIDCKIVVHYHNKGVATRQNHIIDHILYKRFFKGIKIIQLSEYLYKDIAKYVSKENVFFCPNGIPQISNSTNLSRNSVDKPLKILYLSNMMAEKGVWTLVDACRLMHDQGIPFECHFVGGWKDVTELAFRNCLNAYGLEDCVFAHGPKYGDEKEEYWKLADVFVFPTFYHNECFPLVLLEAMQHRVACVSTHEAAIPSIIDEGKNGYMFQAHDFSGLADILTKLAQGDRPSVQKMGETGYQKYNTEYTIEVFEKKISEGLKWAMK